jgi:hypothetical protein
MNVSGLDHRPKDHRAFLNFPGVKNVRPTVRKILAQLGLD